MSPIQAMIVVVLFATVASAQTKPAGWQSTPDGELILRPFDHAPYPHKLREKGFTNSAGKTFGPEHYADSTIGIFIPAGYKAGDEVDYVVHFHGHMNHVSKVIEEYKLTQQLTAAKVNAILIVPQGPKDAPDSGDGKLELDQGGFAMLITEVTRYLNAEKKIHTNHIGRIVLSGHSGGYKVVAAILNRGGMAEKISDVLLLDASYGDLGIFAAWCKNSPSRRLVSLFTDHLAERNKELMAMLDQLGVKYDQLDEASLTDKQLAAQKPVFMHTKGPHDQVPVDYFGQLLRTSALSHH